MCHSISAGYEGFALENEHNNWYVKQDDWSVDQRRKLKKNHAKAFKMVISDEKPKPVWKKLVPENGK
jgi:hypothetical protein